MNPAAALAVVVVLFAGIARGEKRRFDFERPLMGTRFVITCHGEDRTAAENAANEAFAAGGEINRIASDYLPDSELSRLSASSGEPVKVSPLLAEMLVPALRLAEESEGAFDPTLGPLTRLWRESRKSGKLPDPEILAEARSRSGWRHVEWDAKSRTIRLKVPGMQLDLGGIAKGHAADRMFEMMKKHGFSRTCITAGGDLRLGDPPPGKTAWRVGLKTFDPERPEEIVELSNCAVSTSGDLHQFVEIGGKRYSHIIDPDTGLGFTERVAVSVIAPTATLSDPLATAACIAGPERAEALAMKLGAIRVIVRE